MTQIIEVEEDKATEDQLLISMMDARFDFAGAVIAAHATQNNCPDSGHLVDQLFEKVNEMEVVYIEAFNDLVEFYQEQELDVGECVGTA